MEAGDQFSSEDANSSQQVESSLSTIAFKGSISLGIAAAKLSRKILLVYIGDVDSESINMESSTWRNLELVKLLSDCCVLLHLQHGSVEANHFSAFYPYKSSPSISAVGYNGNLLWHHEGYISADDLISSVNNAKRDLDSQDLLASGEAQTVQKTVLPSEQSTSQVRSGEVAVIPCSTTSSFDDVPKAQQDVACEATPPSLNKLSNVSDSLSLVRETDEHVNQSAEEVPSQRAVICDEAYIPDEQVNQSAEEVPSQRAVIWDETYIPTGKPDVETSLQGSIQVEREVAGETTSKSDIFCENSGTGTYVADTQYSKDVSKVAKGKQITNKDIDNQSSSQVTNVVHVQIRLLNGSNIQEKFQCTDSLQEVKSFVDKNHTDDRRPYSLAIPYPRKIFSDEDMQKMLPELNLGKRIALILVPRQSGSKLPSPIFSSARNQVSTGPRDTTEAGPGLLTRILSYFNPFSYFYGSSEKQEGTSQDSSWQYSPNPSLQNALRGQNKMSATEFSGSETRGNSDKVGSSKGKNLGWGSNIHTLNHDDGNDASRDRNTFWNGNSTEFGGDENKKD